MSQRSVTYPVAFNNAGVPQPLTLTPPSGPGGFTLWRAVVLTNNTASVAVAARVGDDTVNEPALPPFTSDLYGWTNARGDIEITWSTVGAITQGASVIATFSSDPASDFAGKVYPAAVPTAPAIATSVLISQATNTFTGTGIPNEFCQDIQVPMGTTALQLYFGGVTGGPLDTANSPVVLVTGDQSGIIYSQGYQLVPNTGLVVSINTAVDQSFSVCWVVNPTTTTPVTITFSIAALLSSAGQGSTVNVTCMCSGGGSGLLAYGVYDWSNFTAVPGTETMTWGTVQEVGAVILQGDMSTFDFPSGSVVVATVSGSVSLAALSSLEIQDSVPLLALTAASGGTDSETFPFSATYIYDASLNSSVSFDATVAGTPSLDGNTVLILQAFAKP